MTGPPSNKRELIASIRRERGRLDDAIGAVPVERLEEPLLEDGMSVKDVMAHVTAWEQRALGWFRAAHNGETPEDRREFVTASIDEAAWQGRIDAFNKRVFDENHSRPLEDVLSEYRRSFGEYQQAVEGLSDEDLFGAWRFEWMNGRALAAAVRGNSDEHYQEHAEQIEAAIRG